ncbi:MAG: hypothetical protein KKA62_05765 [Nanoarchaeota archaeon]|nr:hypothetical protein [Nanoarchaeota archaeon]MBU1644085.1 hypothetical protein [Nanoarchaeota archaeon]MBU1977431.1 hypothetical protein [Nanoarchaeota archaeon]
MEKKIVFRTVIEVLGKPKEHVEDSMHKYLEKLKTNKEYLVLNEEIAEIKKHGDTDLWMIFAELEVSTAEVQDLINFCFDYMPSLIEVIEPSELKFKEEEVSTFLNDLQAKLHYVDMLTKQLKTENDSLKQNTAALLKNYVLVLLAKKSLSSEQLSNLTGVSKDMLEDFLDRLIDQGKIDLKEGLYYKRDTQDGSE